MEKVSDAAQSVKETAVAAADATATKAAETVETVKAVAEEKKEEVKEGVAGVVDSAKQTAEAAAHAVHDGWVPLIDWLITFSSVSFLSVFINLNNSISPNNFL